LKKEISQYDESIQKKLDQIKRSKLNWAQDDLEEDGINVDDELSEEEIGQRFTKLRPDGPRQNDRGGRGRYVDRGQQYRRDDDRRGGYQRDDRRGDDRRGGYQRDDRRGDDRRDGYQRDDRQNRDNRSFREDEKPRQSEQPPKKTQ
jgi:hypothetical protein